jgi:predicted ribosome quality control (RQC) complex YloA/Tae2 family protein
MGKSAKDNIDLLRKAKSWDYWIHLKDYSSAYAIIHRQKEQSVSEQDLIKCAQWLIKEGRNEKKTQIGGRFSVVVAECRYVRPLKGDKLGRVTYHDAREILIAL